MKVATDKMQIKGGGCVPIKLYLQKQVVGLIWPTDCSLLISDLYNHGADLDLKQRSLGWDPGSATV